MERFPNLPISPNAVVMRSCDHASLARVVDVVTGGIDRINERLVPRAGVADGPRAGDA
jgi:hypothetical protein